MYACIAEPVGGWSSSQLDSFLLNNYKRQDGVAIEDTTWVLDK